MSRYPAPTPATPAMPSSGSPGPRWLSTKQAADYLGINVRTLRLHVSKGKLPCRRVGKLYKFEREPLDDFAKVVNQ